MAIWLAPPRLELPVPKAENETKLFRIAVGGETNEKRPMAESMIGRPPFDDDAPGNVPGGNLHQGAVE
jgi:hypothetical protein